MIECADRIVVLRDRMQVGEISGEHMNETDIMKMIAEGGGTDEQYSQTGS